MKLEVGMYIKTDDGIIAKLIDKKIEEKGNVFIFDKTLYSDEYEYASVEHIKELTDYENYMANQGRTNIIKKSSFNIIDLIEVGDYVNGYCVESIQNYEIITTQLIDTSWSDEDCDGNMVYHDETETLKIEPYEIETILTHEQYKANCYKVVE